MKIYTKGGDKGRTSLIGGSRVPKNHPRVEAYGNIDELISYIGILRCDIKDEHISSVLRRIQQNLMLGSAHLASDGSINTLKQFDESEITYLENEIDKMTDGKEGLTAFVLPAAPRASSECHVARTICRRAERSSTEFMECDENTARTVRYLNRLSDYLFTLALYICNSENIEKDFWLP